MTISPVKFAVTALIASTFGIALTLMVPATAEAATTDYTLACADVPYPEQTFYVVPGNSITLHISGFDSVLDTSTSTTTAVNPAGANVVMNADDDFVLSDSTNSCSNTFEPSVEDAAPAIVPPGSLLYTRGISISSPASAISVVDNTGDGDHDLDGNSDCALSANTSGSHVYGTLPITITTAGVYSFRGLASTPPGYYIGLNPYSPVGDPFLAVYSNFDPAHPDANVVGCNDDQNDLFAEDDAQYLADGTIVEGHQSYFSTNFVPGNYTLVLMTYSDLSPADFDAGVSPYDEENFTPGTETTTFQLWGVPGGLQLASDAVTPVADPGSAPAARLAATGTSTEVPGLVGASLLALGLATLATRRLIGRRVAFHRAS